MLLLYTQHEKKNKIQHKSIAKPPLSPRHLAAIPSDPGRSQTNQKGVDINRRTAPLPVDRQLSRPNKRFREIDSEPVLSPLLPRPSLSHVMRYRNRALLNHLYIVL